jgi:hypothetical protein
MIPMNTQQIFGVGPTSELSLRVSVAALARVVFPSPIDGELMLALEHKATLLANGSEPRVIVKGQPFGGAIRIRCYSTLRSLIGHFHFDSERSRSEDDFRIFVRPSDWDIVKDFCRASFGQGMDSDLESDPERELVEEFEDTLGIALRSDQYLLKPVGTVLENKSVRTQNVYAVGSPTARVYRVFEAWIIDPDLCLTMIENSKGHPNPVLGAMALEDARAGGSGRANAMLVLPLKKVRHFYLSTPPELRHMPISFEDICLDGNVPAILEDIPVPVFQRK